MNLQEAFQSKGWMLLAGAADEQSVSGMVEGHKTPLAESFTINDPTKLFLELTQSLRLIAPYASLRYAVERVTSSKIFTRWSDQFNSDFGAITKFCPGWFKDDLELSSIYTIVLRRSDTDQTRDEAWSTLHCLGHILAMHRLLPSMGLSGLRKYINQYHQWLSDTKETFPIVGRRFSHDLELEADLFAVLALREFGRPIVESGSLDQDRWAQACKTLRLPRSIRSQYIDIKNEFHDNLYSRTWIQQRQIPSGTVDVPGHLLADSSARLDCDTARSAAHNDIDSVKKAVSQEPYAPLRSLVEFAPRLVYDQDFINISVRCDPDQPAGDVSVNRREFQQVSDVDKDYSQLIYTIGVPQASPEGWSFKEKLRVVRSICSVYMRIVTQSAAGLREAPLCELSQEHNQTVDTLAALAFSVWRSPGDLLKTTPWELGRTVCSSSPFTERLREMGLRLETQMPRAELCTMAQHTR